MAIAFDWLIVMKKVLKMIYFRETTTFAAKLSWLISVEKVDKTILSSVKPNLLSFHDNNIEYSVVWMDLPLISFSIKIIPVNLMSVWNDEAERNSTTDSWSVSPSFEKMVMTITR